MISTEMSVDWQRVLRTCLPIARSISITVSFCVAFWNPF